MTKRLLLNAIIGASAERPSADNPYAGASESAQPVYISTDTGDISESTGRAWATIATLVDTSGYPGVTSNGTGLTLTGAVAAGAGLGVWGHSPVGAQPTTTLTTSTITDANAKAAIKYLIGIINGTGLAVITEA